MDSSQLCNRVPEEAAVLLPLLPTATYSIVYYTYNKCTDYEKRTMDENNNF